ncbi:MAG: hypothetical protein ACE5JX_02230 [Acidobacteriota bacterium]
MKQAADKAASKGPRVPRVSILLMLIFTLGGSLALLTKWPPGPAHLDWGVWIVIYFGYPYVVMASLFHVKTGR